MDAFEKLIATMLHRNVGVVDAGNVDEIIIGQVLKVQRLKRSIQRLASCYRHLSRALSSASLADTQPPLVPSFRCSFFQKGADVFR